MNTIEARYNASKKEIRQLGVKVRVNIMECCRGCVTNEKLGLPENDETTPIIWHYGGQDNAISWDIDGTPYWRSDQRNNKYYRQRRKYDAANMLFNHSNLTDELKQQIVAIFTKHDLIVDWDMSDSRCIEVNFAATYRQDQAVKAFDVLNSDVSVMC